MRPAPMLRWPTSELPICPPGNPTCNSEASIVVCGDVASSVVQLGIAALLIALSGAGSRLPNPSRMMRTTGRARGRAAARCATGAGSRIVEVIFWFACDADDRKRPFVAIGYHFTSCILLFRSRCSANVVHRQQLDAGIDHGPVGRHVA